MGKTMAEMILDTLTLDLLRDSAAVVLFRTNDEYVPGKLRHTEVRIQVPIGAPGDQTEADLRQVGIGAAKAALREALETLESLSPEQQRQD
nr:hypothetical protein [Methylobacterium sp. Leaf122]